LVLFLESQHFHLEFRTPQDLWSSIWATSTVSQAVRLFWHRIVGPPSVPLHAIYCELKERSDKCFGGELQYFASHYTLTTAVHAWKIHANVVFYFWQCLSHVTCCSRCLCLRSTSGYAIIPSLFTLTCFLHH